MEQRQAAVEVHDRNHDGGKLSHDRKTRPRPATESPCLAVVDPGLFEPRAEALGSASSAVSRCSIRATWFCGRLTVSLGCAASSCAAAGTMPIIARPPPWSSTLVWRPASALEDFVRSGLVP